MRHRILLVSVMVGLAASRGASSSVAVEDGQPAPTVVHLTLDDALERSRARSSRLASLGALSRAAAEGVKGARAGRRPELDVSAGYTRNSDVPELTLASPGSAPNTLFPNLPNNWRTRVAATMPLYTGGRVEGQIEGAAEAERASVSDRAAFENDLTLETHAAYVNVLFALENARVLKNAITSYEAHLKDVRARQDLGLAASSEVLSVTVERERAELGRIQSENLAAIAIANLRRLVGLPGGTALELDAPPETGGEARDEVEALVRQALESRPELEALRARIRAAGASARIAHAAKLPQAGLQAGYDYANPNPRILPQSADWKTSWSVGVNVSWRVLDGGRADTSAAQSCEGNCANALEAAVAAAGKNALIRVSGNLLLDGPVTIGSAPLPALVVVEGAVQLRGPVTLYGLLYATSVGWNVPVAAGALVRGAVISENGYSGDGSPELVYDAAVLDHLRGRTGTFVRVSGSWRDF